MNDRLAHQHTVERVAMERRESRHMKCRFLIDCQRLDASRVSLIADEAIGRRLQMQATPRMLDDDFPGRSRTEIDLVLLEENQVGDTSR